MQTRENVYSQTQKSVLKCLLAILLFCAVCALIGNAGVIKNCKIENSSVFFSSQNSIKPQKVTFDVSDVSGDDDYVHIGGTPIGISVNAGGLIVVDKCAVKTDVGDVYPTARADVKSGDVILSVDGEDVTSIYKLKNILGKSEFGAVTLKINRKGRVFDVKVNATKDTLGQFKLGLALKEDVSGVGTLTFVTRNGKFGALGHHICDNESGLCEQLNSGKIYNVNVDGVVKGEKGKAGGLIAEVNKIGQSIGDVDCNTDIGIYGDFNGENRGDLYKIAAKGEAKIGKAQVLTTIDGQNPQFYDIDIVKVVTQNSVNEKGMVVSVTDKRLIEKTGGIVQGMSGSPIVQNGILIGAITHVFVQDPTRGYAVHSRFMYEYAQNTSLSNADFGLLCA